MGSGERNEKLFFDSAILFAANAGGSVLGFAFHLAVARLAGPAVYADLGALLALILMLSVASFSIQLYVSGRVAHLQAAGENVHRYFGHVLRRGTMIAAVAVVLLLLAAPLIESFLRLATIWGVVVVIIGLIPLIGAAVVRGGLQGTQRFVALGVLRVTEPSVQFGVAVVLILAGLGAAGAISGTVIGIVTSAAAGWFLLRPTFSGPRPTIATPGSTKRHLAAICAFLAFVTGMINIDLIMVKHHFAGETAAQYVAAATMSKFLYLSAVSIAFALFPKTTVLGAKQARTLLKKALLYYLAFALPFTLGCGFAAKWIVRIFYGLEYPDAAGILPILLLGYVSIGVSYLIGMYRVSRGLPLSWMPFGVGAITLTALLYAHPGSTMHVAYIQVGCCALLLASNAIPFWKAARE
jgi:O-antigen/teichoic acid export membrane protein